MEFRKTVIITLYAIQQKRHRCIERILDSEGEGEGGMIWENGTETCILSCKKRIASSMFDTGYRMLGAGARGLSREMIWSGRWEGGSGLGTHVHP